MTFIDTLPTTNFRIFVSVMLAVFFVFIELLTPVFSILITGKVYTIPNEVALAVVPLLMAMMGIDYSQYKIKRQTYIPSPPNKPDIEDKKNASISESGTELQSNDLAEDRSTKRKRSKSISTKDDSGGEGLTK
jgi:hypothetical protein